jgi:hypothetical protein
MSVAESKAALVKAPVVKADASGKNGVFRVASATSNTSTALPTTAGADGVTRKTWNGNFLRVQSLGVDTQVAFSIGTDGAATLVYNQASALGTGSAAAGWTIPNGTYQDFLVPKDATHVNFISSATGGFVEFYMSEVIAP